MDGVLWTGSLPMPGLVGFFGVLEQLDIGYVLATNNASGTSGSYSDKLSAFGLQIAAERILTSAEATAQYLSERYELGTSVYIVGAAGLHEAMEAQGFHVILPAEVSDGATAELVVAGFNRNVTYAELAMGSLLVHQGAAFYGTNPDVTYPSELGPLPGAGALISVISTATGRQPTVIGKPGPIIFQQALKQLDSSAENTAMVGDRLSTDIAGGVAAGLHTILLLSGVTVREDVSSSPVKPEFIFEDIADLSAHLLVANQL